VLSGKKVNVLPRKSPIVKQEEKVSEAAAEEGVVETKVEEVAKEETTSAEKAPETEVSEEKA
jgi:hypothetical protein